MPQQARLLGGGGGGTHAHRPSKQQIDFKRNYLMCTTLIYEYMKVCYATVCIDMSDFLTNC